MLLGVLPAIVVFVVLLFLLVALVELAPAIATWLTPFPGTWGQDTRILLRAALIVALIVGGVALSAVLYTALTLAVGTPIYDRISRAVEDSHGGIAAEVRRPVLPQVVEAIANALRMIITAAGLGLAVAVIGLVPVVGTVAAAVVAAVGAGRIIAGELIATARLRPELLPGLPHPGRRGAPHAGGRGRRDPARSRPVGRTHLIRTTLRASAGQDSSVQRGSGLRSYQ